jgi:hypothetical protein
MEDLAGAFSPNALKVSAYDLYGKFRPAIERGQRGWGQTSSSYGRSRRSDVHGAGSTSATSAVHG